MEFDWCENIVCVKCEPFNSSVLQLNKTIITIPEVTDIHNLIDQTSKKTNLNTINTINDINDCFNLQPITSNDDILLYILYLCHVSNYLRNTIREDNSTFNIDNNVKYLNWLFHTCEIFKKIFISHKSTDISDKYHTKIFKTSSYNFCQLKETCNVHYNGKCNKHHFVFNNIANDLNNLINSLKLFTQSEIDYVFNGGVLKIVNGNIIKIDNNINNNNNNYDIINKNTVCKCFDVVSYVINKMMYEMNYFINCDIKSSCVIKY